MTKEEILAAEVGEELDRLVAVEVMDLICVFGSRYLAWPEVEVWYDMDGRPAEVDHYSTDIKAAWQVVEKLSSPWFELWCAYGKWYCKIRHLRGANLEDTAEGKAVPEAICKAALLARISVKEEA